MPFVNLGDKEDLTFALVVDESIVNSPSEATNCRGSQSYAESPKKFQMQSRLQLWCPRGRFVQTT